jgi:hypothetical protein
MMRLAGVALGSLAAGLAVYGIAQEPPVGGLFWCIPVVPALAAVILILMAEEKRTRLAQAARARASAKLLEEMSKQQVHGERPNRKTI